jgi:hypothetical protein
MRSYLPKYCFFVNPYIHLLRQPFNVYLPNIIKDIMNIKIFIHFIQAMPISFQRQNINSQLSDLCYPIHYQDVRAWLIAVSAQPAGRHGDRQAALGAERINTMVIRGEHREQTKHHGISNDSSLPSHCSPGCAITWEVN